MSCRRFRRSAVHERMECVEFDVAETPSEAVRLDDLDGTATSRHSRSRVATKEVAPWSNVRSLTRLFRRPGACRRGFYERGTENSTADRGRGQTTVFDRLIGEAGSVVFALGQIRAGPEPHRLRLPTVDDTVETHGSIHRGAA